MSGFTLPTSRPITQAWGAEFDDWDGDGIVDYPGGFYHSIGWNGHNGIDYGCYTGDPIEAVADGVVAFAGNAGNWHPILSGGGNAILVEHAAYGVQTEYLHLSRWIVAAGQTVSKGQVIGYSGATGAATAPHLHLGMLLLYGYNLGDRWRGRIDPTPYLYGGGIAAQGSIEQDDFLMALPDDRQERIADAADRLLYVFDRPKAKALTLDDLGAIADAVLDDATPLPNGQTTTPRTKVKYQKQEFDANQNLIKAVQTEVTELRKSVEALTSAVTALTKKDSE